MKLPVKDGELEQESRRMTPGSREPHRARRLLMVSLVAGALALVVVKWLGDVTIYDAASESRRAELHQAILANHPPDGKSWAGVGAEGFNVRLATVWVVEQIHRLTDLKVDHLYRAIDLVSVFVLLLGVWCFLGYWYERDGALAGVFLFGALLPLTMFLHAFHPWDKPSMVLWVAMAIAVTRRRLAWFLVAYVLAVFVKFDTLFAAGMIFFAGVSRRTILRPTLTALAVLGVGLAIFAGLLTWIPGGVGPRDIAEQVQINLAQMKTLSLAYPPLLTHGVFAVLGAVAWSNGDAMAKRLWLFGLALLVPYFLFSNFSEVRAQQGSVLCMLPLALDAFSFRRRAALVNCSSE